MVRVYLTFRHDTLMAQKDADIKEVPRDFEWQTGHRKLGSFFLENGRSGMW